MREQILVLVLASAMAVPVAGSGTQEPEAPKTELQKFHRAVEEINAHVINAGNKLRLGLVGVRPGSEDTPATPAQLCCGNNIDKIVKQFELLAANIRNLRSCYRADGNAAAEVQLNFVHQDASSAYHAVGNFSGAKSEDDVQKGYSALAQLLQLLKKSAKDLTDCEPSGSR